MNTITTEFKSKERTIMGESGLGNGRSEIFASLTIGKGSFVHRGREQFGEGVGENAQLWVFSLIKKKGEEVRAKQRCKAM